jgi:predicted RNA-binding protein associated with RNAse of E/G family
MRKIILTIILTVFFIAGCSGPKKVSRQVNNSSVVSDVSRDGSSYENAIVITEKSETPGVDAEYKWLKEHFPGYSFIEQSLRNFKKKPYDVLKIKTAEGVEKEVYFDISNFFGKF